MTLMTCSAVLTYIVTISVSLSHRHRQNTHTEIPLSPLLSQTVGGTGAICPLAESQLCTNACRKLVSILTLEMTLQFVQLQWLVFCSSSLVGVWDQLDTCLALWLKPKALGLGLGIEGLALPISPSPRPSAPALAWPLRFSSQFP